MWKERKRKGDPRMTTYITNINSGKLKEVLAKLKELGLSLNSSEEA